MKWILVLLVTMSSAVAFDNPGDPVYLRARVWNMGSQVQVEVWNTTDVDVDCRGSVTIRTERGNYQTEYFYATIYRGMTGRQTYWLRDFRDRATYTTEFINCRER
jgi:hypothetical protein